MHEVCLEARRVGLARLSPVEPHPSGGGLWFYFPVSHVEDGVDVQ